MVSMEAVSSPNYAQDSESPSSHGSLKTLGTLAATEALDVSPYREGR